MNDRWGYFVGFVGNDRWGYFVGAVVARWIVHDPRKMMLAGQDGDIWYVDRFGFRWVAEAGRVINGASVPWVFRRIFPAYIGMYRRPSVVHDVACERQDRSSKDVHRMFYEAMRCEGVGPIQAWIMWTAVRLFGPRFPAREPEQEAPASPGTFR